MGNKDSKYLLQNDEASIIGGEQLSNKVYDNRIRKKYKVYVLRDPIKFLPSRISLLFTLYEMKFKKNGYIFFEIPYKNIIGWGINTDTNLFFIQWKINSLENIQYNSEQILDYFILYDSCITYFQPKKKGVCVSTMETTILSCITELIEVMKNNNHIHHFL